MPEKNPSANSIGSPNIDQKFKEEFGKARGRSADTADFLDNERENIVRDINNQQERDLKQGLGTGLTFGALNITGDTEPNYYADKKRQIDKMDISDWRKNLKKQFAKGSKMRRFVRPAILGTGAVYGVNRLVNNALDVDNPNQNIQKQSMKKEAKGFGKWVDEMKSFTGFGKSKGKTSGGVEWEEPANSSFDDMPHPDDPHFEEAVNRADEYTEPGVTPDLNDIKVEIDRINRENQSFGERFREGLDASKDEAVDTAETFGGLASLGLLGGAGYTGYNAYKGDTETRAEEVGRIVQHKPYTRAGVSIADQLTKPQTRESAGVGGSRRAPAVQPPRRQRRRRRKTASKKKDKIAGGPGSGVQYDNTSKIERLEQSPLITIHYRRNIKNQRQPDRETTIQLDDIDYGAQTKYSIDKLSGLMDSFEDWKDEPIEIARVNGDYHLLDGHHRFLAADRLGKSSLPAKVWIMNEGEVRRLVGKKEASDTRFPNSTESIDPSNRGVVRQSYSVKGSDKDVNGLVESSPELEADARDGFYSEHGRKPGSVDTHPVAGSGVGATARSRIPLDSVPEDRQKEMISDWKKNRRGHTGGGVGMGTGMAAGGLGAYLLGGPNNLKTLVGLTGIGGIGGGFLGKHIAEETTPEPSEINPDEFLEKKSAQSDERFKKESDSNMPQIRERDEKLLGGAASAGSLYGGSKALSSSKPDITGRETLYHGTSEEAAESIKNEGIKPSGETGEMPNLGNLEDSNKDVFEESKGKTFTHPDLLRAQLYAQQAKAGGPQDVGELEALKANMIPFVNEGEVLRADVPTWKDSFEKVPNPEADMPKEEFIEKNMDPFLKGTPREDAMRQVLAGEYDKFNRAAVFERDIPTEYIKGGKGYGGPMPSLDELSEYTSKNPGRFAKGIGKGGLGLGLLGAGGYGAYRTINDSDGKSNEDKTASDSFEEGDRIYSNTNNETLSIKAIRGDMLRMSDGDTTWKEPKDVAKFKKRKGHWEEKEASNGRNGWSLSKNDPTTATRGSVRSVSLKENPNPLKVSEEAASEYEKKYGEPPGSINTIIGAGNRVTTYAGDRQHLEDFQEQRQKGLVSDYKTESYENTGMKTGLGMGGIAGLSAPIIMGGKISKLGPSRSGLASALATSGGAAAGAYLGKGVGNLVAPSPEDANPQEFLEEQKEASVKKGTDENTEEKLKKIKDKNKKRREHNATAETIGEGIGKWTGGVLGTLGGIYGARLRGADDIVGPVFAVAGGAGGNYVGGQLGESAAEPFKKTIKPTETLEEQVKSEKNASLSHLGQPPMTKNAKKSLSNLEQEDGWVKYRGDWYPLDEPVKSWRKGKKRAVLASKEEDGEKKVKMIHYGSEDHDHNYSEKAKKNYLSRAKGITNSKGEKTKDDPHSANHWAIKDLWPKDQEADGDEKFDAYTPDDDSRFMSD